MNVSPIRGRRMATGVFAAALLAAATLSACGGGDTPDVSSSPTASTSPTIPPTSQGEPWGDATGLAAPGDVTVDPFLPDALPLPDGLLEDAGQGWVLATYSPTYVPQGSTDWSYVSDVQVVYLVSPEGERYQVLELDPSRPMEILAWNAGDTHVIVRDETGGGYRPADAVEPGNEWWSLDLTSGLVVPYTPSIPMEAGPAGVTNAKLRLWMTSSWTEEEGLVDRLYVTDLDGALLNTIVPKGRLTFREDRTATGSVDPSGNRIAWTDGRDLTVVGLEGDDLTSIAMDVPEGRSCEFSAWLDETRALAFCAIADDTWELSLDDRQARFYEVNVSTGATIERACPIDGYQFFNGFLIGVTPVGQLDYYTPSGAPGDDTGIYIFDGTTLEPIEELEGFAYFETDFGTQSVYLSRDEVMGDVLYGRFGGVGNDGGSAALVRWDSSSHEVTVLIPGHGPFPVDGAWIVRDVLSVVVAQ